MSVIDNWDSYAKHAAPQAIEHRLRLARRYAADANRKVRRLEDLLAERRRQVEAGEWPPPSPSEQEGTSHGR